MQLYSIAFQSSPAKRGQPFGENYSKGGAGHELEERFSRLIEHLEEHVEAPPQWVCTSHYDLHFFDQDLDRFAGLVDCLHWTLAVQANHIGFRIITHVYPPWVSEAMRVEHPETIEQTAAVVADIFEKRGNWMEMRWMRERHEEEHRKSSPIQ